MWRGIQGMAELPEGKAANTSVTAKRLGAYLTPYWRNFVGIIFLSIIGAITQAGAPILIGKTVDEAIGTKNTTLLWQYMVVLFVFYVVGAISSRLTFQYMGQVGQRTIAHMRSELFGHLQKLSLRFFDKNPAGDLMSRIVNDIDVITQLLGQGLVMIIGNLFTLVGIVIAMVLLDWRLSIASLLLIPVLFIMTQLFATSARRAFRKTRESIGDVSSDIQEEIAGVKVAQAFTRTDVNRERFSQRNATNRDANISATAITAAFGPLVDVLAALGIAIVAGYGGYLVLQNQVTPGVVVAFLSYVAFFFRPIQALSQFYTTAQSALAAAERTFNLIDHPVDMPELATQHPVSQIKGGVIFDHVWFRYDARKGQSGDADWVLQDVSLTVHPGEMIALVGPTGSGKTSLVSLIPRLYDVTQGNITIDGVKVNDYQLTPLRHQMSMVLQETFLFSDSVKENIRYGKLDASDDDVIAAAKDANAHELINSLPQGYDTILGAKGVALSQGQRQLIGIARAILAKPNILILDEATSSVDTRTEILIQQALARMLRGRTSFVIAHRLSTIRGADRIVVLDHGKVMEIGSHEQLMAAGGMYADLYQRQFASLVIPVDPSAA
ncbi:MAG: ABC transporter ATP-binding protein [Chloroflexales bacterium]|nr:ABC transporter ATP-binding protein [Chloroflexales bacterium]